MFDNHYSQEYIPYTKEVNVKVTESRAVTDDSIKLYKEFEEKARRELIDRRTIPNNIVKGEYYCMQTMWDWVIIFVFRVNGEVYEVEKKFSVRDYPDVNRLYQVVEKQGTEIILEYVLNKGFESIVKDVYQDNFKKHLDNNTYKRLMLI